MKVSWQAAEKPGGTPVSGTVALTEKSWRQQDVRIVGNAIASVIAVATRTLCEVTGSAEAHVVFPCSRCLADVPHHLFANIAEALSRIPTTREQEEQDVVYVADDPFELDPLLEQALWLELPSKPLCRSDCRGLCARCGADLNEGACDCEEKSLDLRLEGLARFFDEPHEN